MGLKDFIEEKLFGTKFFLSIMVISRTQFETIHFSSTTQNLRYGGETRGICWVFGMLQVIGLVEAFRVN